MAVRSLILVLAAQALTAMPAFACGGDGGGHIHTAVPRRLVGGPDDRVG